MKVKFLTILFLMTGLIAFAQAPESEFIHVASDNWHFETATSGTPFTPFGANYYDPASYGYSELWDNPAFYAPHVIGNFDSTRTRTHFAQLQSIGANVIRIFLSSVKFEPTLFTLDESSFQVVDKIIALAKEYDLRIIFDLVEVWEGATDAGWLSWDYYSDETSMQGLEFLLTAFGNRYADEPAIFAWNITNEPFAKWSDGNMDVLWNEWVHLKYATETDVSTAWPDYPLPGETWTNLTVPEEWVDNLLDQRLFDFQLFREDVAYNWLNRMVSALKAADANHMVTFGLSQWSIPIKENGPGPGGYAAFNPRKLAPLLDYLSVHTYDWWDDHGPIFIRGSLRYCYVNKPVMLEEHEYHRSTIDVTMGSASGWLAWAAFQGPENPDPEAFLFDSTGVITASGEDFQLIASAIKDTLPVREADEDRIDADLKYLVTEHTFPDTLYIGYITMQTVMNGPLGFNFLNFESPIIFSTTGVPDAIASTDRVEFVNSYPNPFTSEMNIHYNLLYETAVRLEVFNSLGRKIITLKNETQLPDTYTIHWDGKDEVGNVLPAGIYFFKLQLGNSLVSRQVLLLR
jgi:hypothetical protein